MSHENIHNSKDTEMNSVSVCKISHIQKENFVTCFSYTFIIKSFYKKRIFPKKMSYD